MTDGLPLTSALAATIAERSVPGLRLSAVLVTLKTTGAMVRPAGLEDALRVYLRDAPASITSFISVHVMFRFIVLLEANRRVPPKGVFCSIGVSARRGD